jgi:internalin A
MKKKPPNESDVSIVGGKELSSQVNNNPGLTSAVGISSDNGPNAVPFCTATLIASNLALTAAHCLQDVPAHSHLFVIFGDKNRKASPPLLSKRIIEKRSYYQDKTLEPHFDIAWIKFEGTAPTGFQPIEILAASNELKSGLPLKLVGYGRTATDDDELTGNRLWADTVIDRYYDSARIIGIIAYGPTPGKGACVGDSGGPAYLKVKDRWLLAGVTNGQSPRILGGDEINCERGVGLYTFAGKYKAWIEETSQVKLLGQTGAPLPPRKKSVPKHENFDAWCQDSTAPLSTWITIDRILANYNTLDCEKASVKANAAKSLNLRYSPDLTPLLTLKNLETLSLSGGNTNIEILSQHPKLKSLSINGLSPNYVMTKTDIQEISKLKNLEELTIIFSEIEDLSPLSNLSNLKKLNLTGNRIRHLQELSKLENLEELILEDNLIGDISPLSSLTNLKKLDLGSNWIKDSSILQKLPQLKGEVNLKDNAFSEEAKTCQSDEFTCIFDKSASELRKNYEKKCQQGFFEICVKSAIFEAKLGNRESTEAKLNEFRAKVSKLCNNGVEYEACLSLNQLQWQSRGINTNIEN